MICLLYSWKSKLSTGFAFLIDIGSQGTLYTNMSSNSGLEEICEGNTLINDNIWHNISVVYNNGTVKHYIDGILDKELISQGNLLNMVIKR